MRPRLAVAVLLWLTACPREVPPSLAPAPLAPAPVLVPLTEDEKLEKRVAAIAAEAVALERERNAALWAHWTTSSPLDLEKLDQKHAVIFDEAAAADVHAAVTRALGDPLGTRRLERWLAGEHLARATAAADQAIAELEARMTFKLAEKDIRWRDLGKLLANEKSAVKRKALWAASRAALPQLSEAYRARDEATGPGEPGDEAAARKLLEQTDAEWKALLEALGRSELGLPADKIAREDLPRLLRPSGLGEAAFPRAEQVTKASAALSALGLLGLPGMTLDLAESPKKNPMPLAVMVGGPADVRVCFRPAGGVRDYSALLGELGRALAIREVADPPQTLPGLAALPEAEASALLFAQSVETTTALQEHGVVEANAAIVARSQRVLRLFVARRAAGNVIAAATGGDEAWRAAASRALSVPIPAEDAARWRLELEPGGRDARAVAAFLLAEQWRKALPAGAWNKLETGAALRADWLDGHLAGLEAARDQALVVWAVGRADAGTGDGGGSSLRRENGAAQDPGVRDGGAVSAARDGGSAAASGRVPGAAKGSATRDGGVGAMGSAASDEVGTATRAATRDGGVTGSATSDAGLGTAMRAATRDGGGVTGPTRDSATGGGASPTRGAGAGGPAGPSTRDGADGGSTEISRRDGGPSGANAPTRVDGTGGATAIMRDGGTASTRDAGAGKPPVQGKAPETGPHELDRPGREFALKYGPLTDGGSDGIKSPQTRDAGTASTRDAGMGKSPVQGKRDPATGPHDLDRPGRGSAPKYWRSADAGDQPEIDDAL